MDARRRSQVAQASPRADLLDLHIPRLDGFRLRARSAQRVVARFADVAVSASATRPDRDRASAVDGSSRSPITRSNSRAIIDQICRARKTPNKDR